MTAKRQYLRFLPSDRLQHLLLLISFTILGFTGLPQKYADAGISVAFIRLLGGIEQTRLIHHTAAVVLIALSIYHLVEVGYRVYVERSILSMLPTIKDVTDFIQMVKYNLGLTRAHPRFERFNFIEKIEYWAVVWGTVLMTITGYILWNPILVSRYFPGESIPAAKTIHGLEAVLAVLAIIIWHSYFVHFAKFNKSVFTGYLGEEEMEEEHAAELERRLKGQVRRPPTPEVRWRRLRLYAPLATLFVIVSLLGTWRFLTVEQTAITTVPRIASEEKVYQPVDLPSPPMAETGAEQRPEPLRVLAAPTAQPMPVLSHAVEGEMAECNLCHDVSSLIAPAPLDHKGRPEAQCLTCHLPQGGQP